MPVNAANLHDVITYHAPDAAGLEAIAALRADAEKFISTILHATPVCGDQQAAIRHVREALMTANAAVVLKGTV